MPAAVDPSPRVRRRIAVVVGVVAAGAAMAAPAVAHTGLPAGGAWDGLMHPFTGFDHLLAMVAVGVVAVGARAGRVAWPAPAGFVLGMVGGGLAGVAGVDVPFVEAAIAASIVLLGLWILAAVHTSGWWLVLPAIVIGAAHGLAHGAELPSGATPLAYVAGFVSATVVLHLAGIGVGHGLRRLPIVRAGAGALVASTGVFVLLAL